MNHEAPEQGHRTKDQFGMRRTVVEATARSLEPSCVYVDMYVMILEGISESQLPY